MEGKFKERPPTPTTFPTPSPHTTTTKSTKTAVDKKSWLFVPYLHPTDPLFLCSYWSSFPADPTDPVFLFCTLILTIFLWRQSGRRTQAISLSDDSFADVTLWNMYEATPESSLNDLTENERNWLGTVLLRDFPEYRHVQDIFFYKNFQLTVQILLRHIFTFCYYSLLCWKINLLFTVLNFSVRDRAEIERFASRFAKTNWGWGQFGTAVIPDARPLCRLGTFENQSGGKTRYILMI